MFEMNSGLQGKLKKSKVESLTESCLNIHIHKTAGISIFTLAVYPLQSYRAARVAATNTFTYEIKLTVVRPVKVT